MDLHLNSASSSSPENIGLPLTPESNPPSEKRSPKGILKSSSKDHTISPTTSEASNLKKKISWKEEDSKNLKYKSSFQVVSPKEDEKIINETILSPEDETPIDKGVIVLSQEIEKWAAEIAMQKSEELHDAQDALSYVGKNPTALLLKYQKQLKEWHTVIRNQFKKAEQYALWTKYRTALLERNSHVQEFLEQKRHTIDKNWTEEELNVDWDLAKKEPWAQQDSQYDAIKSLIAPLVTEYRQAQSELKKAKEQTPSFTENSRQVEQRPLPKKTTPEKSNIHSEEWDNRDMVSVPGVGWIDKGLYDIGNVEYHEGGGHTIIDMTGRRYDYPPKDPSPNQSSCTIS